MAMTVSILRWLPLPRRIVITKIVDMMLVKCYHVTDQVVGYSICYYDERHFSGLCCLPKSKITYDMIEIYFWKELGETPTHTILRCRTDELEAIHDCYLKVIDKRNLNRPRTLYHTSSIPIISRFIDKLAKMIKTTNHREKTLNKIIDLLLKVIQ